MKGRAVPIMILTCMVTSMLCTLWLLCFEKPWLSYPVQPFPMVGKQPVIAGSLLALRVMRCNSSKTRKTYTIARSLVSMDNGVPYVMDDLTTFLAPGCKEAVTQAHRIPEFVPTGHYRLIGLVSIQGIVRTQSVSFESETFNVEAQKP